MHAKHNACVCECACVLMLRVVDNVCVWHYMLKYRVCLRVRAYVCCMYIMYVCHYVLNAIPDTGLQLQRACNIQCMFACACVCVLRVYNVCVSLRVECISWQWAASAACMHNSMYVCVCTHYACCCINVIAEKEKRICFFVPICNSRAGNVSNQQGNWDVCMHVF